MNTKPILRRLLLAALLLTISSSQVSSVRAQGTAFTYQGRLNNGTNPATGSYDLTFTLFSVSNGVGQVGSPLTNAVTSVSNGLFTATLDFGNQFTGASRWLEIGVRSNGVGTFQTLTPRQSLTPLPYSIYAESANATNLVGTIPAGNVSGVALLNVGNAFSGGNETVMGGSVGIGTTAPANKLDVRGSADFIGSVGIGTVSPAASLQVASTNQNGVAVFVGDRTPFGFAAFETDYNGSNVTHAWFAEKGNRVFSIANGGQG
jgi:hypothetical protein